MKNKNLPSAIVFDLDDTIVAFDQVASGVWEQVATEFFGKHPIAPVPELLKAIHEAAAWFWSDPERHRIGRSNMIQARRGIVRSAFDKIGFTDYQLGDQLADTYSQRRLDAMYVFPGARETLSWFAERNVPMALLTNGESIVQRGKINRFGLSCFFKAIFIEGELGYGKPDIRVYSEAARSLGVAQEQCWIVGDNLEWEIRVPKTLGFYTIWNDFRGQGLPPDTTVIPDRVIRSIAELQGVE